MRFRVRLSVSVLAGLAICACSSPDDPVDASVPRDARADAGRVADGGIDADVLDGGTSADAGVDAGPPAACAPRPVCPPCLPGETCGGGGVLRECGSRACTHHVAPTSRATDFASCTTAATPCTLAAANLSAQPGDVVCLAGGEYVGSPIAPSQTGMSDAPIVFAAADPAMPPVIRGVVDAISLDGVSFIEVDGVRVQGDGLPPEGRVPVTRFFNLVDADDNWIRNSTFYDAWAYVGGKVDLASQRNRFTGNTFEDAPGPPPTGNGETRPADTIEIRGARTLVEGNSFGDVSHIAITIWITGARRTVVRGNSIRNRMHAGMSFHTPAGESGRALVEDNRIFDTGELFLTNPNDYSRMHTTSRDDGMARGRQVSMQLVGDGVIFRRNDVASGGRGMWITGYPNAELGTNTFARNARLVHNTFSDNLTSVIMANDAFLIDPFANIVIQNNLFDRPRLRQVHIDQSTPEAQSFLGNGWTPPPMAGFRLLLEMPFDRTDRSLAEIEAAYGPHWADNVLIDDPRFRDRATRDYRLAAGSTAIDAATWLTTITSSEPTAGGTLLHVADAWWFYDGWDIPGELGDLVMTEGGQVARVTAVDIEARTVAVTPAIPTTPDEGLAFAYTGTAPDLGAHEVCP
jgi:hypothetical protein